MASSSFCRVLPSLGTYRGHAEYFRARIALPSSRHWQAYRHSVSTLPTEESKAKGKDFFLQQVHETAQRVIQAHDKGISISKIRFQDRESLVVARRLEAILEQFHQGGNCPRCWLKKAHCICEECPPLEAKGKPFHRQVNRIFLLMHHREVCLKVDTAKMILAAFPETCRLVVSGIGPEFQPSLKEMLEAMGGVGGHQSTNSRSKLQPNSSRQQKKCLVLFPTTDSKSFDDWNFCDEKTDPKDENSLNFNDKDENGWDLIVLDGTWSQARRLHERYIPSVEMGGPRRVQLCLQDLDNLMLSSNQSGKQLRKHPVQWKEIGTLEALRLLLRDILQRHERNINNDNKPVWETLLSYQDIANTAARKQRGQTLLTLK